MIKRDQWIKLIKNFAESPLPSNIHSRSLQIPIELTTNRTINIIGPRRCGKTYEMFILIQQLLKKKIPINQILYINFESIDLFGVNIHDMIDFLDIFYTIYPENYSKEIWFFLDEIQVLTNWEIWVRSLIDKGIHVYLSGSSSKLLSKEISTQMRGRSLIYEVYPLSFRDYLTFQSFTLNKFLSSKEENILKNLIWKFLNWGSYPEVCLLEQVKEKILHEIIEVTIQKDIIERYNIRNIKLLRILFKALINSKQFSVNKFFNYLKTSGFKISKNTLYDYLEYLKDSMIIFPLKKYAKSYKTEESSIRKIYFVDNGILRISGVEDRGRLLENCVYIELLRREGEENIRYYTKNGKEIDFVVKKGAKVKQLIQVSYTIEDFQTKDREFRALIIGSEDLKCQNLLLLTWDSEGEEEFKEKIIHIKPLWKWLLDI
ncbi:ATP-binding protein [Candidatus Harpocratesius sp.]